MLREDLFFPFNNLSNIQQAEFWKSNNNKKGRIFSSEIWII